MTLSSLVKEYGQEVGLDVIRITSAEPFLEAEAEIREQRKQGFFYRSRDWGRGETRRFCNPAAFLKGARTVISVAECYLTSEREDLSTSCSPHGLIARYTWRNYYFDTRMRLKKIAAFLTRERPGHRFLTFANSGISEKPAAVRAGTGFYGKHSIVITEKYGSWVVLGEIITDLDLEPDSPLPLDCGSCTECIEHCPTKALVAPYVLNRHLCIQTLTNSLNPIPVEFRTLWGRRFYGCTTCQDVCPLNRKVSPQEKKPGYGVVGSSIPLIPMLKLTPESHRERFRKNQIGESWIHTVALRRNAALALGNSANPVAVSALVEALGDRSPLVRGQAAWSLARLGGKIALSSLRQSLRRESDQYVQREIREGLSMF